MTIEFELANLNAEMVTLVFIANRQDQQPVRDCSQATVEQATFHYTPWQLVNASAGAREYFSYSDTLSVVVRPQSASAADTADHTDGQATIQPSALTRVAPGRRYLAFNGEHRLQIVDLGENKQNSAEICIVAAPANHTSGQLAVDWYQAGTRIGITEPLAPRTVASFVNSGVLLFQPVSPDQQRQRFTPDDLAHAWRYRTPSNALKVKASLRRGPEGNPDYAFVPASVSV